MYSFIAAFIDWSTECEKTAPMTRVHTRYNEIVAGATGDVEQRAWGAVDLSTFESRVKIFKKMLIDAFDERCNLRLYTLKYHLLHYMVKYIQKFGTLSVSRSSPHKHFIVHIKQAYSRTSQRRHARMMETVGVMESKYEKAALFYWKKKYDQKSGRSDESIERLGKSGLYVVRDGIVVTIAEMARALMWVCAEACQPSLR